MRRPDCVPGLDDAGSAGPSPADHCFSAIASAWWSPPAVLPPHWDGDARFAGVASTAGSQKQVRTPAYRESRKSSRASVSAALARTLAVTPEQHSRSRVSDTTATPS